MIKIKARRILFHNVQCIRLKKILTLFPNAIVSLIVVLTSNSTACKLKDTVQGLPKITMEKIVNNVNFMVS